MGRKNTARSYALAEDPQTGDLILHRPDCPLVRAQAARGRPVMTMIDVRREPTGWPQHECLQEERVQ